MLFAFDPNSGQEMGAMEYHARYGHLKGKERKAVLSLQCRHEICRGKAYITPSLIVAGFQATGRAITQGKPKKVKGPLVISHNPFAAHADCPDRHSGDKRFANHTLHATESEIIARNKSVLLRPDTRERNRIVLGVLFEALHGRAIEKDDQKLLAAAARTAISREFIADNPWAYPYMIVLLMGPAKVAGEEHARVFSQHGMQMIPYKDTIGKMLLDGKGRPKRNPVVRKERAPREIQLCRFVPGEKGFEKKPIFNDTTQRPVGNFEVSKRAALDIIDLVTNGRHDDFDFLKIKQMTAESTQVVNDAMVEAFELTPLDPAVERENERRHRSEAAKRSAPLMIATRKKNQADAAAAKKAQKLIF